MQEHIFADGISSISVMAGTVRLDIFTFSSTEKDAQGQPKIVAQQRLVMPIQGFFHATTKMREAAEAITKMSTPAPSDKKEIASAEAAPAQPSKPPFP